MAHFAELDANNIVLRVIVVHNDTIQDLPFPESESVGVEFCQSLFGADTIWKQTSYNNNFRERFGQVGFSYNSDYDCFVMEKPFASWVFDEQVKNWVAPVPVPDENTPYFWNEETLSWDALPQEGGHATSVPPV